VAVWVAIRQPPLLVVQAVVVHQVLLLVLLGLLDKVSLAVLVV
jgi:hypothetical protein